MSDSFADLWNSSAPPKPSHQPPPKLGAQIPQGRPAPKDLFSLLASSSAPSSSSSAPASRSLTPHRLSPQPADAFSELLSGSLVKTQNSEKLTIAQRAAAQAEKERLARSETHERRAQENQSAWAGLHALAAAQESQTPSAPLLKDDWTFDSSTHNINPGSSNSIQPHQDKDHWNLLNSSSKPPVPSTTLSASAPIWDLDSFVSAPVARQPSPNPTPTIGALDDDFLLSGPQQEDERQAEYLPNEDDNLLGILSEPVDVIRRRLSPTASAASSRPTSPPPHVVGQIVEMGFSPQQARIALAATDTGVDVQAALETLLSNGAAGPVNVSARAEHHHRRRRSPTPRSGPTPATGPSLGAGPESARALRSQRQGDAPSSSPSLSYGGQNSQLQEQADKLLAQASGLGLSVFNKANALWVSGKEKALKAYEERAKAGQGFVPPTRPKWMKDAGVEEDEDHHDRDFEEAAPSRAPSRPKPRESLQQPKATVSSVTDVEVFPETPKVYVSPFRRVHPASSSDSSAVTSLVTTPLRAPSPIQRKTVVATRDAMSLSSERKLVGNEKYKLGQYAEAEVAYTAAIDALPQDHLLLIPLYNNRAATRLKIGDCAGAVADTSTVISLVGSSYDPTLELRVTSAEEGAEANLQDGLVKAWKRRAEAWEGKEKWSDASKDWEALAGCAWASGNTRAEGVRGVGRCRRMLGDASQAPSSSARRKPPPRMAASIRQTPSQTLTNLRRATSAQEAEENARFELKDAVDARLNAWKGGKETNIRALIASLDAVLWPELGWVKVGMGELVSEKQVKVRYTKAIARLHPDKLTARNVTVEQRMIANGVFAALNDAWNTFRT